jgi:hypothetical protein
MKKITNEKTVESKPQDAIDCIKNSGFYGDKKYSWLLPLINKVLTDPLT